MKTRLLTVAFASLISAGIFAQSANQQKTPAKAPAQTTTQAKTPAAAPAKQTKPDTSAKTAKSAQTATPKTKTNPAKPVKK